MWTRMILHRAGSAKQDAQESGTPPMDCAGGAPTVHLWPSDTATDPVSENDAEVVQFPPVGVRERPVPTRRIDA